MKKQVSIRNKEFSYLTQDETRRLLSAISSKRDHAIFLTAYRHGLRASEIGMLTKASVDLERGRLTIRRAKGSLDGIQPMQPDEVKALRAYLRTRTDNSPYLFISNRRLPIDRRTLLVLMRNYAEAARIPESKRKFHALKHSIATHLLDAGADLAFVKDWLGHANIQNTTIYARLTNPTRDENARRFFTSRHIV